MSEPDVAAWTRQQVEADLAAARIINAGGFSPQRWDTEPPGQVNPDDIPQSDAVTAALGVQPEYICGWVQIVAYDKLNNEPDEAYGRDSGAPFALIDNGRREVDHIIRNDPRNRVADLEAKLAILDLHGKTAAIVRDSAGKPGWSAARDYLDGERELCVLKEVVLLVAAGFKYRAGYRPAWNPDKLG